MTFRFPLQHLLALISLLSYRTFSFLAADAVQDPGNDGWYGLAPIDVNPRLPQPKYVNFGNSFSVTADGQTMTAMSQEWVGPNTDDLAVQKTTITSDGNPYAQFVETTVTKDGKPAVATNLVVTPKILSILDSVRAEALSSCHKKAKRQACDLKTIGQTTLEDLVRKWASREGVVLGTKVVTALVGIHLLGAMAKTQFNGKGNFQYAQPLFNPVLDIPTVTTSIPTVTTSSSSSSTEPAITAWIDPQYQDIDAILALSITADSPKQTADTSPSLFCSKTANPPATVIVDRAPAISHGAQFCRDTANSTYGLGLDYNGTEEEYGSFTYFERWADTDNCKDKDISYTIDEQKCGLYINMTIDACNPPAPDNYNAKHGGTVTDGCMVFEMKPRIMESVAPSSSTSTPTTTDPPPPAPTKPCPDSNTRLGDLPCDKVCPNGYDRCGDGKSAGISGISSICLCKDPCGSNMCMNPDTKWKRRSWWSVPELI